MSYNFSTTRTIVAAKQHVCDQCRKPIHKGDTHNYVVGKVDGDFYTAREHVDCCELWKKLWSLRGLGYGDIQDMLIDDEDIGEEREWITAEYPEVAGRLWP